VRGIAGEVGLSDVMALRSSVEEQKTDEGWLVTTRRISRAARDEVKKEENRHLDCYTFDELIDLDADFSGYVDWLETEIQRRKVDTKYVPLACSKEEIDPFSKRQIGVSRYGEEDGWIDGYIDLWLDDLAKEHISILGEFGTGKTWFAFHYAWVALQRYKDAQKRGVERPRLPLVITLRDFAKALNVENVLAGFFFTQHNIRINSDVFDQLNRMGKLLLIFDGFDEMAAKVDKQQMINNFWELAKVVVPGAKVILTCRTEHFPEAQEGRALLNAELSASTKNLSGETPQFEVLELEKFDDEQIRQVLLFQAEPGTVEQVMGNPQLLDLARRPVMTELILEALPDIEAGKPVDMARVYLYAVRRKMERDIKSDRTFTSLADKLYFLCELSWEMLSNDEMSLNYKLFPDRIRRLFGVTEKDLDHWHYDMMAQTMLIRNASGDYTPAHRSLLEFFVAYKFAAELGVLSGDFIELAQGQSCLDGSAIPIDYTWSGYFSRQLDNAGNCVAIPTLKGFVSESLEKLRETFGREVLTKALIDLLVPMLDIEKKEAIIKVIEGTRGRSEDEVDYVGGNAATLAVRIDKGALEGRDFGDAVIKGADFTNAYLMRVNFAGVTLRESLFTQILGGVQSVAFSPDGTNLVASDSDGQIHVWQFANGKKILSLKGHLGWISSIVFSPDGTMLASAGSDRVIRLWDIKTGTCLKILQGHTMQVRSVMFSPSGTILASCSQDMNLRLWDIKTGECVKVLSGHTDLVRSVAFNADGRILASASHDKTIRLWNTNTGECVKTLHGHTGSVRSVAFSPNGKLLASGSGDRSIRIWDVSKSQCLKSLEGHTNSVESVVFSPNGYTFASACIDAAIKLWNIETGDCQQTLSGHTHPIQSIAFSPDSKILASGSHDLTIRLWDVNEGKFIKTVQGYPNWVLSVAFNNEGKILASTNNNLVSLWDVTTGICIKNLKGHSDWVWSLSFSPLSNILASGSQDTTIKIWDIVTGTCLKTLQGEIGKVRSISFSPDGKLLASCGYKSVQLWDVLLGKCLKSFQGHTHIVNSVAFSHNGKLIVSGCYDRTIRLWNISTGECIQVLEGHTSDVHSVVFSPDDRNMASGSADRTVKIWELSTGQCIETLQGHAQTIRSVAFSPNGQNLVSCSTDQTIKIWDVTKGICITTLQCHLSVVRTVVINPDGTMIASGSQDGMIKLWDWKKSECLKTLELQKPYDRMNITGIKGLTDAEIATLQALGAVDDVK
jgi:predicted NACHT family NTPase